MNFAAYEYILSLMTIEAYTNPEQPLFSILIPSWNNLDILSITINSILKNSTYRHQIIVHVNEGTDGTIAWLEQMGIQHTYTPANAGVCYGFNLPSTLATCDYILLSDDDNYFCPGWDKHLYEEVQKHDDTYWCISGTLIERELTGNACVIAPYNYGKDKSDFKEDKLLAEYDTLPFTDWQGANWYPMVLPRKLWQAVGGLSIEFSPGMYSDPDFMMKLWHFGVREFKGISKARAYHFMSKTTSRVKKNDGAKMFLLKWGMSSSTFLKYYLQIGRKTGDTGGVPSFIAFKDRIKRMWKALI
jgi:glycosyltransferase involved in cell wall biosynthesis